MHLGSQDTEIHTVQSTSTGVGHTDPLKMPDRATLPCYGRKQKSYPEI